MKFAVTSGTYVQNLAHHFRFIRLPKRLTFSGQESLNRSASLTDRYRLKSLTFSDNRYPFERSPNNADAPSSESDD